MMETLQSKVRYAFAHIEVNTSESNPNGCSDVDCPTFSQFVPIKDKNTILVYFWREKTLLL